MGSPPGPPAIVGSVQAHTNNTLASNNFFHHINLRLYRHSVAVAAAVTAAAKQKIRSHSLQTTFIRCHETRTGKLQIHVYKLYRTFKYVLASVSAENAYK